MHRIPRTDTLLAQRLSDSLLVETNLLCRVLNVPGRGPWRIRAMMAAVQGHPELAYLDRIGIAARHRDTPVSAPPQDHPSVQDLAPLLEGTGIHTLFLQGDRPKKALQLRVWKNVFFTYARSRWTIFGQGWVDQYSTALPTPLALARARAGQTRSFAALHFCGDVFSPDNPGHFINDQIPRGLQFRDWLDVPVDNIGLPQSRASACGLARDLVLPGCQVLEPDVLYHCEHLALLSSQREHGHPMWYLDPRIVAGVTTPLRKAAETMPGAGRAIYLSRLGDSRRPLRDEAALARRLAAKGVRILSMGEMGGAEQLGAIHNADLVIAPHGGALGTLAAARPGTHVLELFSPRKGTLCYAGVARAIGLEYRMTLGRLYGRSDGWAVDHDAVLQAVDQVLVE